MQPLMHLPYHELTIEERLLLISEIWDTIDAERRPMTLTDGQRQALDRRLAEHRANPQGAKSWDEVKAYVRARVCERQKKSA